jgi:hypothetical protein
MVFSLGERGVFFKAEDKLGLFTVFMVEPIAYPTVEV